MAKIFISYRRDDSEGEAGRLFDELVEHFGEASVFMDVAAIQAGRDFRKAIDESVATCGVLLSVIGRTWLDIKNEAGQRRLDDPMDFVRLETAHALKRDIPVIPVLVHGAKMPAPDQLPDDLRDLHFRNCCELSHARWSSDVQVLIKALGAFMEPPPLVKEPAPQPQPRPVSSRVPVDSDRPLAASKSARLLHKWWIVAAVISIILVGGILMMSRKKAEPLKPVKPPMADASKTGPGVAPIQAPAVAPPFPGQPEMVKIPSGAFAMGSPNSENGRKQNEGPVHQVGIQAFELGRFEVSVEQFQVFVDDNPDLQSDDPPCSAWKGRWEQDKKLNWKSPGFRQSSKNPVVCVSWLDAQHYADWLNKKSSIKGYRLPSEGEWEYAARAGSTGPRYWPPEEEACHYAVTAVVSPECRAFGRTMPVGERIENQFHLFDMLGNASEWTEDCWNNSYANAPANGEAWKVGNCNLRAVRGGSWMHGLMEVRSAFRTGFAPPFRSNQIGFRVARTLP